MKTIQLIFIFFFIMLYYQAKSQNRMDETANKHAKKMAKLLHLQDSLSVKLYTINLSIVNSKMYARQRNVSRDSLHYYIQLIENKRDTLYRTVLSREQFQMYKKHKEEILKMD